ncbi:unnamed protein product [Microthlaspi erraticum]|uniref:Uncharacterized protein n=1 Tax=Microthlaspi erraticum TaxID=1685480 RepID=A0A6D2JZ15_9BRAS|nr:unnamed protein product [Microthlaspi erraticum]
MFILNEPITFSHPTAWGMDQWEGAIRPKWMGMGEAAPGVLPCHWLHAEARCRVLKPSDATSSFRKTYIKTPLKRSYNQKSEDCPDGSIENQRPTAQSGWPRNECSALGQNRVRPTEVSAKVQTTRPITHDPGNMSRGRPSQRHATPRTTSARAGKQASRPRNLPRTTADASVRAGKERPTSGREFIGQISSARPRRPTRIRPTRPFRLAHDPTVRPIVPTDRPNAAVDPKPVLKPKLMFSSPA